MAWVVYLFASGLIFFLGILLILMSMSAFVLFKRKWLIAIAQLSATVGLLFVITSATPMPLSLFYVGLIATLLWLVAERNQFPLLLARRKLLRILVVIVWLVAAGLEFTFRQTQALPIRNHQETLYVIGDSVTAGMGGRELGRWPDLVAERYSVKVVDLAQPGATAKSALQQAEQLPPSGGSVLLEIGGNDLLGTTSATQFERDLDQLLTQVCVGHPDVVMMELPLPPLCGEYGRIQRRLAARYNVKLIPKRIFIAVLTSPNATLDSIHLSKEGHRRMASALGELLFPE